MIRRFAHLVMTLLAVGTLAATIWTISQNPFAQPFVNRTADDARDALTRAMQRTATPAWLTPRLEQALDDNDTDQVELLLSLAHDHEVAIDPILIERAQAHIESRNDFLVRAGDCTRCAIDIAACQRLTQMAACALPVEISPLGDINALRRAGVDWATGRNVDKLDAGLALAGLGATGLTISSGGAALPLKTGVSVLRLARRLGALTPAFVHSLRAMADGAIRWEGVPDFLIGRVELRQITDSAKLASLAGVLGDVGRVRAATSTAETLTLLRHVDNAQDARSLAILAETQGHATRKTLSVLGKARSFRLLHRLSDMALLAIGLLTALAYQVMSLFLSVLRTVLRPRRRRLH